MSGALLYASKRRIMQTPLNTWRKVLALLDDAEAKAGNDALLEHGWHLLFGQPAVLQGRFMQRHLPQGQ